MAPAELIRSARARQGITPAQLALRADLAEAAILEIEAGRLDVDGALLARLLLVMGERPVVVAGALRTIALDRRYDREQLAELRAAPPGERLRHALGWNSFAARVADAGARARAHGR